MKVRFGAFTLDSGARQLLNGRQGVHLSPKAFDLLEILVARRPNVVSKEILLDEVWPGKVVEEANLAIAVGEVRKALGDDSKSPALVVTVARRGYRFAAEAEDLERPAAAQKDLYPRWWLTWRDTALPLREGDNIVGRHPASAIWINGGSVSRSHARIIVSSGRVTIEDLGSRNGTFVDGNQLSGPHQLLDGAEVTFGSERATFREWSDDLAAGTEPIRPRR
ncbi:MAG TPA: FHA domain-containing protein [Vicinamibacterales bacterium]|nr:FHA domain-containing protein [Vicinamibacterales bacterium]